jgi:hypothetical protein
VLVLETPVSSTTEISDWPVTQAMHSGVAQEVLVDECVLPKSGTPAG